MFGEIIYDNFLFDIPKILDLCVLFGKGNSQLLHKMIGEMFEKIPAFDLLKQPPPTPFAIFSQLEVNVANIFF